MDTQDHFGEEDAALRKVRQATEHWRVEQEPGRLYKYTGGLLGGVMLKAVTAARPWRCSKCEPLRPGWYKTKGASVNLGLPEKYPEKLVAKLLKDGEA